MSHNEHQYATLTECCICKDMRQCADFELESDFNGVVTDLRVCHECIRKIVDGRRHNCFGVYEEGAG